MTISRRDLLKRAVAAGAAAAVAGPAEARHEVEPHARGGGDAVRLHALRGVPRLPDRLQGVEQAPADAVTANGGVYDAPNDLNSSTKNVIKAYAAGNVQHYVKQQCMHCVDPSCVSVCMLGALHKEGEGTRAFEGEKKGSGIVLWDKWTCVGCRYCQIGCPFNVPKFEWFAAFPKIVKCELCRHRRDEKKPGRWRWRTRPAARSARARRSSTATARTCSPRRSGASTPTRAATTRPSTARPTAAARRCCT